MKDVLFVTWDGPSSPYLETLFLPVFEGLSRHGYRFHVLQFTWGSKDYRSRQSEHSAARGVGYTAVRVPRGSPAVSTVAMIAAGAVEVRRRARACRAAVVMPRSILPGAMTLVAKPGAPWAVVFDADGLPADERVEFGGWSSTGSTYRAWRWIEAASVRSAGAVVTRTGAARHIVAARARVDPAKIFVIPNARDDAVFMPGSPEERAVVRKEWGVAPDAPCLLFAGSMGPQYFPDEMFAFYRRILAQRPDARFVVLTADVEAARAVARKSGLGERVVVRTIAPSDMPRAIASADLGLSLRATTFSQRAVSPVKLSEYLLCGVPAVSTPVGDVEAQLGDAGLVIGEPNASELDRAADWFVGVVVPRRDELRVRAREIGLRHFALGVAVHSYARVLAFAGKPTA